MVKRWNTAWGRFLPLSSRICSQILLALYCIAQMVSPTLWLHVGLCNFFDRNKVEGSARCRRIRWMGLTQRRTRDSFRSLYVRINSKAYACMHASLDSASLAPHACVIDVACGLHVCWPAYSPVRLLHRAEQRIKQAFTTGTWLTRSQPWAGSIINPTKILINTIVFRNRARCARRFWFSPRYQTHQYGRKKNLHADPLPEPCSGEALSAVE